MNSATGDIETATTFGAFVRATAAAYGDDPAVTLKDDASVGGGDTTVSFRQLDDQSATLARGLIARGVGKVTGVGFILGNGPQFALTLAAIARIGAVAIPISTLIKANELVRVLRQSDVTGLIVQRTFLGHDYVERLCDALPALRTATDADLRLTEAPYLRWVVSTGDDLPATVRSMNFLVDAAATVGDALLAAVEADVHSTDQMLEIYTSGSMALPKGVRHHHGPVLFRARYLIDKQRVTRGGQSYAAMPMFWVGGLMIFLLPNWAGGATTLCSERTVADSRMAMGSVLAEDDLKKMPQTGTHWALGMTETLGPYSFGDLFRAPGRPVCAPLDNIADGYEMRVVDEDGTVVGEGGTGEIQVRGYPLTSGLHKVERSDHFTPDGFYHTGDMGLVEGPRVHFVGRGGDMIKTGGSNVSPAEVEMEMQQLDGVHSAYVVGLPDAERGQLVVAANRHGPQARMQAYGTMQRMLMEQIVKRRVEPGEDILSWLIAAEVTPPGEEPRTLTDDEIVIFARLLLLAGGGTTWRQLGIVLYALLTDRTQLEAVRADRTLIDLAIDESLRWNPTNPTFSRVAVTDVELGGVTIPQGAVLDICLGAANRDPARWTNPDVFDLHRPFQQHLGTGIGAHMCLGRFVAQAEMNVTINRLLDHFPAMRLDPDAAAPYITGGLEQRGVSSLPVLLR